jgi:hypothetical protein
MAEKESNKEELMELIEKCAELAQKIAEKQNKREDFCRVIDRELGDLYREQSTLYEKKRLLEREYVDSLVLASPSKSY